MAKLSAHKAELLRIERETEVNNPESSITWARKTRTFHADGKILEKYDVRFKPSQYEPHPGIYSYGWKVWGKLKPGIDPATHAAEKAANIRATGSETQWKIVNGGPAPIIISPGRIMRAVESGEHIGFCKECGHPQGGCEPDARGYQCESCGAIAIYGAEEMLLSI